MSIDESSAARLRTIGWRWVFGSLPSALNSMRYRPLDAAVQRSAAARNVPPGSLYAQKLSVTVPELLSPPHAPIASMSPATSAVTTPGPSWPRTYPPVGGVESDRFDRGATPARDVFDGCPRHVAGSTCTMRV